jgi:ATP-dependent RNA helicase DeaD
VRPEEENKPDILQYRIQVPANAKADALVQIIEANRYERVLAFCNTKSMVERLTKLLEMKGCPADCIHGDMRQANREKVMSKFRKGNLRILVATDVASRGIDVEDVDAVFNYDVPDENEYYVHRIGRTGRAKKHGAAYTFVSNIASGIRLDEIAKNTRNEIIAVSFSDFGKLTEQKRTESKGEET